jgi:hypothetical protein
MRIWAPIVASSLAIRTADQPLTALTRAHGESWRYEPGSDAETNASQAAGSVGSSRVAVRLTLGAGV